MKRVFYPVAKKADKKPRVTLWYRENGTVIFGTPDQKSNTGDYLNDYDIPSPVSEALDTIETITQLKNIITDAWDIISELSQLTRQEKEQLPKYLLAKLELLENDL